MLSWTYDTWVALSIVVSIADFLWGNALTSQRLIPHLDARLIRVRYIVMRRHLQHIRDDRRMRNHNRLWPPRRATRERQERDLRLPLSRPELALFIPLRPARANRDELVDGLHRRGARGGVREARDALGGEARGACGIEGGGEEVGVRDDGGGFGGLELVDELVGGVGGVRGAGEGKRRVRYDGKGRGRGNSRYDGSELVNSPDRDQVV